MSFMWFLLFTLTITSQSVLAHYGCGADRIKHKKIHKNMNVKPIPHKSNLDDHDNTQTNEKYRKLDGRAQNPDASGIHDNIRIHVNTSRLQSDWKGYGKLSYFVDDVIPAAYEWIQNTISVRPVNGPLTFDVRCDSADGTIWRTGPNKGRCVEPNSDYAECGDTGALIDDSLFDSQLICATHDGHCESSTYPQGQGLSSTDLIIYFTGDSAKDDSSACDNVMGFAAYCHTNARDRPIAGYINLCRSTIDATDVLTWEETVSLIIHETFHVLGFSSDGFSHFKNSDETDRSDVYRTISLRGKLRAVITLPTVVEKAREFFDCATMEGVELEDYGVDWLGDPSSHWDNRIVAYDFMISYVPPAAPYSVFSLAVLADSGWYSIAWNAAQEAPHGRGIGCAWSRDKCIVSGRSIDESVFCTQNVQYSCSTSYVGKFYCALSTWNAVLPDEMQYFVSPTKGGDNVYPDFCPLLEQYSNGDCRLWGINNNGTSDANTGALGGLISGASKCGLIEGETNGKGVGCYPTHCFSNYLGEYVGTRMTHYRNYKLSTFDVMTCWSDEDNLAKKFGFDYAEEENFGFDTIYCPVFEDICYDKNPWICNGHGTISSGVCVCSPGYFGRDCTIENTAANRQKYTAQDSVSVYDAVVCGNTQFDYDLQHHNVGILNLKIGGINGDKYVEHLFQNAVKNWIAVLVDIAQCDVELSAQYNYNQSERIVTTDLFYYSSDKTWQDVSDTDATIVFNKLFDSDDNSMQITEQKLSDGVHEDNIDAAAPPLLRTATMILLFYSFL
eukprot:58960_1